MNNRYSLDGTKKICTGFFHKEKPEWLPLDRFYIHRSGRKEGKAFFECKECRSGRNAKPFDPKANTFRNKGPAEVVDARQVGALIREFSVRWLAERPTMNTSGGNPYPSDEEKPTYFMGPIDYIAYWSKVNPRVISGVVNDNYNVQNLSLAHADAILTAIGQYDQLGKTIEVRPNPNWSLEKYVAYMAERGCI